MGLGYGKGLLEGVALSKSNYFKQKTTPGVFLFFFCIFVHDFDCCFCSSCHFTL